MRLDALFTIPAQQVGALFAEAWGAYRRSSGTPSVPPLSPSLGLLGEALLDRTFTLLTSVMVGMPLPETVRRMVDDLLAAHAFYDAQGWLADPAGYHRTPPPVGEVWRRSRRTFAGPRLLEYEHMSFPSGWAPHEGEPGRERWLAHPVNGNAHVYVLQHEEPRPWLVGVHGFAMGTPLINFSGFPVRLLHEELGLNLALPVLPLHGPRGAGGVSGGEVLQPDLLRMVHLFAQGVWDVRRTLAWIRAQSDEPIGLYGISLGGYVSALVAALRGGARVRDRRHPGGGLPEPRERQPALDHAPLRRRVRRGPAARARGEPRGLAARLRARACRASGASSTRASPTAW